MVTQRLDSSNETRRLGPRKKRSPAGNPEINLGQLALSLGDASCRAENEVLQEAHLVRIPFVRVTVFRAKLNFRRPLTWMNNECQ